MLKSLSLMLLSSAAMASNTVVMTDMKEQVLTRYFGCEVNRLILVPMEEFNSALDVTCEETESEKVDGPYPTGRYTPFGSVRVLYQRTEVVKEGCNLFAMFSEDGNTTYYFQCF